MKYSLSPSFFLEGSGYIVSHILTQVIIQKLSISKNNTSSIVLPGWAILEELIFHIALAAGPLFSSIRPVETSWVYISPLIIIQIQ